MKGNDAILCFAPRTRWTDEAKSMVRHFNTPTADRCFLVQALDKGLPRQRCKLFLFGNFDPPNQETRKFAPAPKDFRVNVAEKLNGGQRVDVRV